MRLVLLFDIRSGQLELIMAAFIKGGLLDTQATMISIGNNERSFIEKAIKGGCYSVADLFLIV